MSGARELPPDYRGGTACHARAVALLPGRSL